jgi:hypothetical protein
LTEGVAESICWRESRAITKNAIPAKFLRRGKKIVS